MRKLYAILPFMLLGIATYSKADIAGQVGVKLEIGSGCEVNNSTINGNMNDFGDLDFGQASTTWSNVLSAQVLSSGNNALSITCGTASTPFEVTIDGGTRGTRSMLHSTSSQTIAYSVYRDPALTNEYTVNTAQSFITSAANAATTVPIYGAVPANNVAVPNGIYEDTLLVNISF